MGSGADSPCQGEMARRARGGRVGDYEHEVLIRSRPRWRFGHYAAVGKVTRRPQTAESPCDERSNPIIAPSSVWPSASHLSLSPLAFGHLPLIRGVGTRGGRLLGGSAPSSGPFGATFPPGGRLFGGERPLTRPRERPGKAGGPVCRPYEKSGETLYIKL